jgi:hypothetical protein
MRIESTLAHNISNNKEIEAGDEGRFRTQFEFMILAISHAHCQAASAVQTRFAKQITGQAITRMAFVKWRGRAAGINRRDRYS